VLPARGVIHAGDCIETGDPAKVKMQQTEWTAFAAEFGLIACEASGLFPPPKKSPVSPCRESARSCRGNTFATNRHRISLSQHVTIDTCATNLCTESAATNSRSLTSFASSS